MTPREEAILAISKLDREEAATMFKLLQSKLAIGSFDNTRQKRPLMGLMLRGPVYVVHDDIECLVNFTHQLQSAIPETMTLDIFRHTDGLPGINYIDNSIVYGDDKAITLSSAKFRGSVVHVSGVLGDNETFAFVNKLSTLCDLVIVSDFLGFYLTPEDEERTVVMYGHKFYTLTSKVFKHNRERNKFEVYGPGLHRVRKT